MRTWTHTTLGEISDRVGGIIQTGPFGSQLHEEDYSDVGVPVVMPKDIVEGRVSTGSIARIPANLAGRLARHRLAVGDIVYGRRGDIGRQALVTDREAGWLCGTGCLRVSLGASIVSPLYLHYYLRQPDVIKWISNHAVGATLPNLNTSILRAVPVALPSHSVQRRIASILAAYDNLIENCERRIRVLDEMARALYREWFVDFRYPGHESVPLVKSVVGQIPASWTAAAAKDVATVTYGFPFKSALFSDEPVGVPVVRIRDVATGESSTYTTEGADARYEIGDGDLLVGMDGDFHMILWSNGRAMQNQRIARFEPQANWSRLHFYLALEPAIQRLNRSIVGTTVAHLGDMHIREIRVAEPTVELLSKAKALFEPISRETTSLRKLIRNLKATRDLLLPRLLSGQLSVDEVA